MDQAPSPTQPLYVTVPFHYFAALVAHYYKDGGGTDLPSRMEVEESAEYSVSPFQGHASGPTNRPTVIIQDGNNPPAGWVRRGRNGNPAQAGRGTK